MSKPIIKMIILLAVLVGIIALITVLIITSISLGNFGTLAIKDISEKKVSLVSLNDSLQKAKTSYDNKQKELEAAKNLYKTEKAKYEAISEETIKVIQDATKEEKYFIEYLWITLGNYAKSHSLSLTVVDPGSKVSSDQTSPTEEKKEEKAALVTIVESSSAVEEKKEAEKTKSNINSKENVITIQIKGNYISVADFVFEVENDKTLRFKLDNISMKSAGGTDVTASFEVKNLVIIK